MPVRFQRGMTIRVTVARGRRILATITNATHLVDGQWWLFFQRVDGKEKGHVIYGPKVEIVSTATGPRMDPAERFWKKATKSDGCWLWQGKLTGIGYGMFKLGPRSMHASRAAYILTYGPISDPLMFVCHRCDNPRCVRPDHLFLGTHQDNMDDAKAKNRIGGKQKLAPSQREEIRVRRNIGESLTTLASAFNVSRTAIVKICR